MTTAACERHEAALEMLRRLIEEHHRQYHRYDGGTGWQGCATDWCRRAREAIGE